MVGTVPFVIYGKAEEERLPRRAPLAATLSPSQQSKFRARTSMPRLQELSLWHTTREGRSCLGRTIAMPRAGCLHAGTVPTYRHPSREHPRAGRGAVATCRAVSLQAVDHADRPTTRWLMADSKGVSGQCWRHRLFCTGIPVWSVHQALRHS